MKRHGNRARGFAGGMGRQMGQAWGGLPRRGRQQQTWGMPFTPALPPAWGMPLGRDYDDYSMMPNDDNDYYQIDYIVDLDYDYSEGDEEAVTDPDESDEVAPLLDDTAAYQDYVDSMTDENRRDRRFQIEFYNYN